MSIPNHSILPATEADLPTIVDLLQASKLQLAINRFVIKDWPNEPAQRALYTSAVEGGFKAPHITTLKVTDDVSGDIVGYLVVARREGNSGKKEPTGDRDADGKEGQKVPDGVEPEVYKTVMQSVEEINRETESVDHIEVTHICVRPSSRKQGIGSQLIKIALDKAKAEGLPLALCAEPPAHGFFLKQGFKDTRTVDIDLSKWAPERCGWGVFRIAGMTMSDK